MGYKCMHQNYSERRGFAKALCCVKCFFYRPSTRFHKNRIPLDDGDDDSSNSSIETLLNNIKHSSPGGMTYLTECTSAMSYQISDIAAEHSLLGELDIHSAEDSSSSDEGDDSPLLDFSFAASATPVTATTTTTMIPWTPRNDTETLSSLGRRPKQQKEPECVAFYVDDAEKEDKYDQDSCINGDEEEDDDDDDISSTTSNKENKVRSSKDYRLRPGETIHINLPKYDQDSRIKGDEDEDHVDVSSTTSNKENNEVRSSKDYRLRPGETIHLNLPTRKHQPRRQEMSKMNHNALSSTQNYPSQHRFNCMEKGKFAGDPFPVKGYFWFRESTKDTRPRMFHI